LPEEEIQKNPNAVMKDLNWEKRGRKLMLGPRKRRLFIQQLVMDVRVCPRGHLLEPMHKKMNQLILTYLFSSPHSLYLAFDAIEYYGL
jgi:hypothetical protein